MKEILRQLFTDGAGQHELSAYSWLASFVGAHALIGWHEINHVVTTLTEYMTAMCGLAAGHGIAYMTRK